MLFKKTGSVDELFSKKNYSQDDCDNLKAISGIFFKYDKRGEKQTVSNLNLYIPGLEEQVFNFSNDRVKDAISNGKNIDEFIKKELPLDIKIFVGQRVALKSTELAEKCRKFQQGGKKTTKKSKSVAVKKPKKVTKKSKK